MTRDKFMKLYWWVFLPLYIVVFVVAFSISDCLGIGLALLTTIAYYWAFARAMR